MNSPSEPRSIMPLAPHEVATRVKLETAGFAPPDALSLLKALRRRSKLASVLGLSAALLAGFVAYLVVPPAKYSAQAMLHVANEQPRILVKTSEAQSDYSSYQRTQLAMLRSRLVLGSALKQPEVASLPVLKSQVEPIEWLEKQLKVDFAESSEILRISISGINPTEPALLVNAVVQAYLDEVVNVEVKQRRERADMLKEVWNRYQENLRSKRDEVRRLSMAAGSDDKQALAVLRLSEAEQLAKAESELARTRDEMRRLRVEFEVIQRNRKAIQETPAAVDDLIARDPSFVELLDKMNHARSRYEQAKRGTREGSDPSVRTAGAAYETARTALENRRNYLRPLLAGGPDPTRRPEGADLAGIRERLEVLEGLELLQAEDTKRLMARSQSTTRASVDLSASREEIFHADELARKIGGEIEALNLELQAPARIRLRERAEVSRTKDETRQIKTSGAAALGAFALTLVGISFWEFQSRRIDSAGDLTRGLGVRIVGTLPALPKGRRDRRRGESYQNRMIESVDSARTSLVHLAREDGLSVIMVGSAMGGEGKTSLACHLAASLARSGRETLLIDCDLRRPSAHRVLDVPGDIGVSEILRGEIAPEEAVVLTSAPHLAFLPAGRCDAEALRALSRDELGALLGIMRRKYEFVVIDSPPVLPVADALLIGQHADAVVFTVMREVSQLPKVQAAYDRLAALGIRMLGVVMANTHSDLKGSDYYYSAPPANRA